MSNTFDKRTLSSKEIQNLEFEKKLLLSSQEREQRDNDSAELIALDTPDATQTRSGRQIRRYASRIHDHEEKSPYRQFMCAIGLGDVVDNAKQLFIAFQSALAVAPLVAMTEPQTANAKKGPQMMEDYEDDGCVINMERVSQATARILEEERAEIEAKVRELEGITNPSAHREFANRIVMLAEQYEMMEHPKFPGHFVHNFARVEREELVARAHGLPANAPTMVFVYRVKAEIGGDAVKVERRIGDIVYNQNPQEVQLNSNEAPRLEIH